MQKWEIPTDQNGTSTSIVDDICSSIEKKLDQYGWGFADVEGIGVGAPGFIDGETGFIYQAVNIAGWRDVDLKGLFKKRTGLPISIENDANAAALGENWAGAGNSALNMAAITLGTGVGGGVIVNGKIVDGVNGTAGEIGHITIDPDGHPCNCGRRGCLETIASATGIARQAMEIVEKVPFSRLADIFHKSNGITAQDVFALAAENDAESQRIIDRTTDVLGRTLASLAAVINPSCIVIGGGVSKANDQLRVPLEQAFRKYALQRLAEVCEIKIAKLGNDAGLIGAASLVFNQNPH
ncbi:ROK family glucokinase [Virgibacillus halophilus]|uniref:Glucokinase n=1 Tax=Tigheibacillus halophilus TaxID=361280 RepID=A0ABU5CCH3_9BACI|nr:ROK family glucokinase [Virgibacillus halophilus]